MSKTNVLLKAFQERVQEWVCGYCNSESNQPAATFREIKKLGYSFEEHKPNRWGKNLFCSVCNATRTHYKLLSVKPVFAEKPRINIRLQDRNRILDLFEGKDAITGAKISSTPEIDHKVPYQRLNQDIDTALLDNNQLREHFQLLTREHNLLKERACSFCIKQNIRPPLLGIAFWYEGNQNYQGTCVGCGWFDAVRWRQEINKKL